MASQDVAARVESGRLKAAIDAGELCDRHGGEYDLGASPLGTDDEAGGTPTPASESEKEIRERLLAAKQADRREKRSISPLVAGSLCALVVVVISAVLAIGLPA